MKGFRGALALFGLLLGGCAGSLLRIPETRPGFTTVVNSPDLRDAARWWVHEASRRYPSAVVFASHGTSWNGEWWCENGEGGLIRVEDVAKQLRHDYPGMRVVLVVCNPGHHDLDIPGVTHAMSNVWVVPDRLLSERSFYFHSNTGNIYEFDED